MAADLSAFDLGDVTLCTEDGTVPVHRSQLQLGSSVFRGMFDLDELATAVNPQVPVCGTVAAWRVTLPHLYPAHACAPGAQAWTWDTAYKAMPLLHLYDMRPLAGCLDWVLHNTLSVHTCSPAWVLRWLRLAEELQLPALSTKCLRFVRDASARGHAWPDWGTLEQVTSLRSTPPATAVSGTTAAHAARAIDVYQAGFDAAAGVQAGGAAAGNKVVQGLPATATEPVHLMVPPVRAPSPSGQRATPHATASTHITSSVSEIEPATDAELAVADGRAGARAGEQLPRGEPDWRASDSGDSVSLPLPPRRPGGFPPLKLPGPSGPGTRAPAPPAHSSARPAAALPKPNQAGRTPWPASPPGVTRRASPKVQSSEDSNGSGAWTPRSAPLTSHISLGLSSLTHAIASAGTTSPRPPLAVVPGSGIKKAANVRGRSIGGCPAASPSSPLNACCARPQFVTLPVKPAWRSGSGRGGSNSSNSGSPRHTIRYTGSRPNPILKAQPEKAGGSSSGSVEHNGGGDSASHVATAAGSTLMDAFQSITSAAAPGSSGQSCSSASNPTAPVAACSNLDRNWSTQPTDGGSASDSSLPWGSDDGDADKSEAGGSCAGTASTGTAGTASTCGGSSDSRTNVSATDDSGNEQLEVPRGRPTLALSSIAALTSVAGPLFDMVHSAAGSSTAATSTSSTSVHCSPATPAATAISTSSTPGTPLAGIHSGLSALIHAALEAQSALEAHEASVLGPSGSPRAAFAVLGRMPHPGGGESSSGPMAAHTSSMLHSSTDPKNVHAAVHDGAGHTTAGTRGTDSTSYSCVSSLRGDELGAQETEEVTGEDSLPPLPPPRRRWSSVGGAPEASSAGSAGTGAAWAPRDSDVCTSNSTAETGPAAPPGASRGVLSRSISMPHVRKNPLLDGPASVGLHASALGPAHAHNIRVRSGATTAAMAVCTHTQGTGQLPQSQQGRPGARLTRVTDSGCGCPGCGGAAHACGGAFDVGEVHAALSALPSATLRHVLSAMREGAAARVSKLQLELAGFKEHARWFSCKGCGAVVALVQEGRHRLFVRSVTACPFCGKACGMVRLQAHPKPSVLR